MIKEDKDLDNFLYRINKMTLMGFADCLCLEPNKSYLHNEFKQTKSDFANDNSADLWVQKFILKINIGRSSISDTCYNNGKVGAGIFLSELANELVKTNNYKVHTFPLMYKGFIAPDLIDGIIKHMLDDIAVDRVSKDHIAYKPNKASIIKTVDKIPFNVEIKEGVGESNAISGKFAEEIQIYLDRFKENLIKVSKNKVGNERLSIQAMYNISSPNK